MNRERRDVIKSKSAIKNAYMRLSLHKPNSKITIQELIDEANISKGTFYAYYQDIYDLGEQVENDLVKSWSDVLFNNENKSDFSPKECIFFLYNQTNANNLNNRTDGKTVYNYLFFQKLKKIIFEVLYKNETAKNEKSYAGCYCTSCVIVDICYDLLCNENSPVYQNPNKAATLACQYIQAGTAALKD